MSNRAVTFHHGPDGGEDYFLFQNTQAIPHEDLLVAGTSFPMPSSVECDNSRVVMTFATAADVPALRQGKMLSGAVCVSGGDLLHRVVACSKTGAQLTCEVERIAYNAAFRSSSLDVALVRQSSLMAMLRGNNASELPAIVAEALREDLLRPYMQQNADWIDKTWPLGRKSFNYNGAGGATQELPIAGDKSASSGYWLTCKACWATASLDVEVKLSTSYLHLDHFSVIFKGHAEVNLLFEAGLRYTGSWGPYEKVIYSYSMLSPLPTVKIGPVSFTLGPVLEFGAGFKANINAVITATFGARASADLQLGISYDQATGWRWIFPSPSWSTSVIQPTLSVSADLRAESWLFLRPKIAIGDVLSFYAEVKPKAGLTGSYGQAASQCTLKQFYYKFDYGFDAKFGYKMDIDISVLKQYESKEWPYVGPWNQLKAGCVSIVKANEEVDPAFGLGARVPYTALPALTAEGTATVFVDPQTGADEVARDGSVERPWETVAYAIQRLNEARATDVRIVLTSGVHWVDSDITVPAGMTIEVTSISGSSKNWNSAEDTMIDCYDQSRAFIVPRGAALTLRGLTVRHCQSTAGPGGAVNVLPGGAFTASACHFSYCMSTGSLIFAGTAAETSAFGGAIACHDCQLRLEFTQFDDNTASSGGAVSACGHQGVLVVDQCQFRYNRAELGGALRFSGLTAQISGTKFEGNTAFLGEELQGGAIYVSNLFAPAPRVTIDGCHFTQNRAQEGGALLVNILNDGYMPPVVYTPPLPSVAAGSTFETIISATTFEDNFALGLLDSRKIKCGGAVAVVGSGAHLPANTYTTAGNVLLQDCYLDQNQAHLRGGAVCAKQSIVEIDGSMVVENMAVPVTFNGSVMPATGGALYCDACKATFGADTVVSGNSVSHYFGGPRVDSVACVNTAPADCTPCGLVTLCNQCDFAHPDAQGKAPLVAIVCDDGNPYSIDTCEDDWGCVSTPMFPHPVISEISPAEGSPLAGERVVLQGSNLVNIDDISDVRSILIGNNPCRDPVLLQRNPDRIACTTTATEDSPNVAGAVEVQLINVRGGPAQAPVRFAFIETSSDSSIAALAVTPGVLRPAFDPRVTEYQVQLANAEASILIKAAPAQEGATIYIDGENTTAVRQATLPLRRATTEVKIRIVAPDNRAVTEYTVVITLPAGSSPATGPSPVIVGISTGVAGLVAGAAIVGAIAGAIVSRRRRRAAGASRPSEMHESLLS